MLVWNGITPEQNVPGIPCGVRPGFHVTWLVVCSVSGNKQIGCVCLPSDMLCKSQYFAKVRERGTEWQVDKDVATESTTDRWVIGNQRTAFGNIAFCCCYAIISIRYWFILQKHSLGEKCEWGGEITHRFKCQSEKGCRWMWVLWMTHKGRPSSGVCLGKG